MASPPPPFPILPGRDLARKTVQSGPTPRQLAGQPSLILAKTRKGNCYSDRPVTAVGISAGVSYGALGTTQ